MKHSQVKGKTLKMKLSIKLDEKSDLITFEKYQKNLQPNYFKEKNNWKFEEIENGVFSMSCEKAILYLFDGEELPSYKKIIKGEFSDLEYVEKINRCKLVILNAKATIDYKEMFYDRAKNYEGLFDVKFRNKDYLVYRNGKEYFGEELRASNFNESGFSVRGFEGCLLNYTKA